MSKKIIHFGVVGLGNIASTHAHAINGHDSAMVSAACSRSEGNRKKFGKEFESVLYSDYSEMLTHDKLDAVTICTPSGTHLNYALKAAEAGKHVVIEKPIEITVERGKEIIECCRQNGVKLAVIYQNRYSEGVIQMRSALNAGSIGTPVMARASVKWYRDQQYYKQSSWRGTLKLDGGGAVINQAIHTLDLLIWMMGDVESVSAFKATLTHPGIEAEDNAVAILKFKSGTLAQFEASTSIVPAQPRRIEINGTHGTLILEDDRFIRVEDVSKQNLQSEGSVGGVGSDESGEGIASGGSNVSGSSKSSEGNDASEQKLQRDGNEGSGEIGENSTNGAGAADPMAGLGILNHSRQYESIIEAILNNKSPEVSGAESLKSLAVVEAIYQSADSVRVVLMSDILK